MVLIYVLGADGRASSRYMSREDGSQYRRIRGETNQIMRRISGGSFGKGRKAAI